MEDLLKRYFFLFSILLCPILLEAQIFDSLSQKFKSKPVYFFKFDTRNSFISARRAVFSGVKFGFKYDNSLIVGLGVSFLNTDIALKNTTLYTDASYEASSSKLSFYYISPFLEYVFYKDHKWEHAIPIQLGFGYSNFRFKNKSGLTMLLYSKPIILYEPAMTTEYKIFPWLALGGGLGYRLLLINNKIYGKLFNSPIYLIKFNIIWDSLPIKVFDKESLDN